MLVTLSLEAWLLPSGHLPCLLLLGGAGSSQGASALSNIISSSRELSIRETAELPLLPGHLVGIRDRFPALVKAGGTSSPWRPLLCFKVGFISVKGMGTRFQRLPSNPKAAPLLCLPTQLNYKPHSPKVQSYPLSRLIKSWVQNGKQVLEPAYK